MYSVDEIKKKKIIDAGSADFLTKEEIKWLINQAGKVEDLQEENKYLNKVISRCRCEECGNELGEKWSDENGILCEECVAVDLDN
jgi:hypothetical protein